jgi:hypothetical protein
VGYSVKAGGILEDLLGSPGVDRFLIRAEDVLSPPRLIGRLIEAYDDRERTEAAIREALPGACARAQSNFDRLASLVAPRAAAA